MIYKQVSMYNIVEKLYRDYDSQEELDIWDVVEWGAEALEFIGAGQQFNICIKPLTIVNNSAELPCDFHSQPQPLFNGIPMPLATGSFDPKASPNLKLNNYYIRDGIFVTSLSEGEVMLSYRAINTDDEGFPTIPDLISYRTAVTKYIQMMLDHRDFRKGRISDRIATKTEKDWHWYCKQARGAANMPNLSMAESFKNMWVKLKPEGKRANGSYGNLGTASSK